MLEKIPVQKFWCYNHSKKWFEIEGYAPGGFDNIPEFIEMQGFLGEPDILLGDEFNFVAVFDHPKEEKYLFHTEIEKLVNFSYADSFPGMLVVMEQLNYLINSYLRTVRLLEMGDEE